MPKSSAAAGPDDKIFYILTVLKHTDLNKPDYHAIAQDMGLASANHAQKKFKAYIEQAGFKLVDRQVIGEDGKKGDKEGKTSTPSSSGSASSHTTPSSKKSAAKQPEQKTPSKTQSNKSSPSAKKRKVEEILVISDDEEGEDERTDVSEDGKDEEVKQEAPNEAVPSEAEAEAEGDGMDMDEDGDRFRRSGRSMTLLPKAENVN